MKYLTFKNKNYEIYNIDCMDSKRGLESIPDNSIDFIITDPPYFIDGMDSKWDKNKLDSKVAKSGVIGSLPVGMKFDKSQSVKLQEFMTPICKQFFRILKPGAFCVIFSQARLYHAMATSADIAGFEIRDMLVWKYSGQAKAFSLNHFIDKDKNLNKQEKAKLKQELKGLKTPQLRPQIEPMVLAQKPRVGTFLENYQRYKVGLMDATQSLDSKFPSNFISADCLESKNHAKDSKNIEKTKAATLNKAKNPKDLHVDSIESTLPQNDHPTDIESKMQGDIDLDSINPIFEHPKPKNKVHLTQKPVELISHLIKLFTRENQIVLDPFLGSGSHAIAALESNRKIIGFELNPEYFAIARRRIESI